MTLTSSRQMFLSAAKYVCCEKMNGYVEVFNPETKCPVHVHCYRCDSPETAAVMHANLQNLLNKKEAKRHIADLEYRLLVNGLIGTVAFAQFFIMYQMFLSNTVFS